MLKSFEILPRHCTEQGLRTLELHRQYIADRSAQQATEEARQARRFNTNRKNCIGDEYLADSYYGPVDLLLSRCTFEIIHTFTLNDISKHALFVLE